MPKHYYLCHVSLLWINLRHVKVKHVLPGGHCAGQLTTEETATDDDNVLDTLSCLVELEKVLDRSEEGNFALIFGMVTEHV